MQYGVKFNLIAFRLSIFFSGIFMVRSTMLSGQFLKCVCCDIAKFLIQFFNFNVLQFIEVLQTTPQYFITANLKAQVS